MPRGQRLDLTGQRFGRLVVVERVGSIPSGKPGSTVVLWRVKCDCGTVKTARAYQVRVALGCGCMKAIVTKQTHTTHGATANDITSPEYTSWKAMRARCYNPHNTMFYLYGARGVYVCARWRDSFGAFLADVGPRTTPTHSIDRVDSAGSYTCGACEDCVARGAPMNARWATDREQQRNRRDNLVATIDGETRTLREWAEIKGMRFDLLRSRVRHGWPTSDLFLPAQRCRREYRKAS